MRFSTRARRRAIVAALVCVVAGFGLPVQSASAAIPQEKVQQVEAKVSVSSVRTATVHESARQRLAVADVPVVPTGPPIELSAAAFPNTAVEAGLEGRPIRYSALTCRGIYEFQIRAPMGPGSWSECVAVVEATLYQNNGMHTDSDGFLSIEEANQVGGFNLSCLDIAEARIIPETFEALANERPCVDGHFNTQVFPHLVPIGSPDLSSVNYSWQDAVLHVDPAITQWLVERSFAKLGAARLAVCTTTHEAGLRNWAVGHDASGWYGGAFQTNAMLHANGALLSVGLVPFDVMDIGYSIRVTYEQVVYMLDATGVLFPVGTWGGSAGCH